LLWYLSTFAKTTPPVNQSNTSAKVPADNLNIHPQLFTVEEKQNVPSSTAEKPSIKTT
jgi:hypothetical protein